MGNKGGRGDLDEEEVELENPLEYGFGGLMVRFTPRLVLDELGRPLGLKDPA